MCTSGSPRPGWTPPDGARPLLTGRSGTPVLDTGLYRQAIEAGNPDRRPLFTRIDSHGVTWPDGAREPVDVILLATGYRPALQYLAGPALVGSTALDDVERPIQRGGLSTTVHGLGFVGLEWQRSFASATLRGVGRDARHVLHQLYRRQPHRRARWPALAPGSVPLGHRRQRSGAPGVHRRATYLPFVFVLLGHAASRPTRLVTSRVTRLRHGRR
jgi:putative flavoprotein involved in K+ transport